MSSSQSQPTSKPIHPLSELTLSSPSHFALSNILNTSPCLQFTEYPNSPALFNIQFASFSSRTGRISCELYSNPSHIFKSTPIAKCENIDLEPGKLELVLYALSSVENGGGGEKRKRNVSVRSELQKEKNGDWIWTIAHAPDTWRTKMHLPSYDSISTSTTPTPPRTLKFRWQHMSLSPNTTSSLVNPDWKLISLQDSDGDGQVGEVHAVLSLAVDGTARRGQLEFRRSFGDEWERAVVVLAGVLGERERMRREARGGFTKGFLLW